MAVIEMGGIFCSMPSASMWSSMSWRTLLPYREASNPASSR
jgi:hypothetical protein